MIDKLKNALDSVRAEQELKAKTLTYLREKVQSKNNPYFMLIAASMACFLILSGVFTGYLLFTPSAYVDLDVNPSIGLTLNRFGRVIASEAYNDEGGAILDAVDIRHKPYDEATKILLDEIIAGGYITKDELISVTVTNGKSQMLTQLEQCVKATLAGHNTVAHTDVFFVTAEERTNAHSHHISPAKYLAITELQEVDPSATIEGCKNESISNLRERARQHVAMGHSKNENHSGTGGRGDGNHHGHGGNR